MERGNPKAGQENSGHKDTSSWWQDNSAVIIAILSVAVVAIRLLGVSRGDPQIAYAILQSGGTGNVLIGTLVSTLGLLAIPAAAVFAVFWYDAYKADPKEAKAEPKGSPFQRHVLIAATLAAAYIAVYTAPIGSLVISFGLAILSILMWYARRLVPRRREEPSAAKWVLSVYICLYIFGMVIYEVATPTPWLPIQNFSIAGQGEFSGYTLSQTDGETFILTSNPDEVISIPSQRIQVTTQCTPHRYIEEQATVVYLIEQLLNKIPNYPACLSARYSQSNFSATPSPYPTGRA